MTDNEIIRCLRHCRAGDCENCKSLNVCDATFSFHKEALNLINRQKAEIERLQESGKEAISCFTRMESLYKIKCKELEVAKSEAIKDFAERLKECSYTYSDICGYKSTVIDVADIENLVKEMCD